MPTIEQHMAALDRAFDALERGDLDGFMAIVSEHAHADCEFTSAIGTAMGGRAYRGLDEIRAWFADLLETIAQPRWIDRSYEAVSNDAFMFFARFEMKGASSGIDIDTEVGQLYELESGLVKRGTSFASHAQARAAAEAIHA
jgi:ketosteroid isomerase-like protein